MKKNSLKKKRFNGTVFLAGPYRSDKGSDGIYENLYTQRRIAKQLWAANFAVVSVNLSAAFMDGHTEFETFEEGAVDIMLRCDAVIFAPGWENSKGCAKEMEAARENLTVITLDGAELSRQELFSIASGVHYSQWRNRLEPKYPAERYPNIDKVGPMIVDHETIVAVGDSIGAKS